MFWLLDAIERFVWRCMREPVCHFMLAIATATGAMCRQQQVNLARWQAWGQRPDRQDADGILGRLRAGQGQFGSCEIEPAIAA